MKREALEHTKIRRLARLLGLQRWGAIGVMESIWHLAAKETPCGDIGKLSDDDIATTIEWKKKSSDLVQAIVESGFFDKSDQFRLVIHDWWDHCDDGVHMKVARATKFFVCGRMPKLKRIAKPEREDIESAYKAHAVRTESARQAHEMRTPSALPSQALPSQANIYGELPPATPTALPPVDEDPIPIEGRDGELSIGKSKRERKVFVKPTIEEVEAYCSSHGITNVNPKKFFWRNESTGWVTGRAKTPMKDWKAAIQTWAQNNYDAPQQSIFGGKPAEEPTTLFVPKPRPVEDDDDDNEPFDMDVMFRAGAQ